MKIASRKNFFPQDYQLEICFYIFYPKVSEPFAVHASHIHKVLDSLSQNKLENHQITQFLGPPPPKNISITKIIGILLVIAIILGAITALLFSQSSLGALVVGSVFILIIPTIWVLSYIWARYIAFQPYPNIEIYQAYYNSHIFKTISQEYKNKVVWLEKNKELFINSSTCIAPIAIDNNTKKSHVFRCLAESYNDYNTNISSNLS